MVFADRVDAGKQLASLLTHLAGQDVVVLGLPRGGVPVAAQVARALNAPLDVIVVRKLGLPSRPEVAMGAIGEDGARVLNPEVVSLVDATTLDRVERQERSELDRRLAVIRAVHPAEPLAGRSIVVVDDGIATGATASAACQIARTRGAARVVLAVPVAPPDAVRQLSLSADEVIAVSIPKSFQAVGEWYIDFEPTSEAEVVSLLRETDRTLTALLAARDEPLPGGGSR